MFRKTLGSFLNSIFPQKFDITYTKLSLKERFWICMFFIFATTAIIYLFGKIILITFISLAIIFFLVLLSYKALTSDSNNMAQKRLNIVGLSLIWIIITMVLTTIEFKSNDTIVTGNNHKQLSKK